MGAPCFGTGTAEGKEVWDVRCWGLLAKGVKLRLEEQKLQVEGN